MRAIAQAHQTAGRNVINLLREQLGTFDMSDLLATGSMKIDVGKSGGGRLCILRIEEKSPNLYKVRVSRLNLIDSMETSLWHE